MAVDALELRPRQAVALFDAAVRLCATSTGAWALTLPAGAALVAALFNIVEAVQLRHDLTWPVAWCTGAWVLRALSQGAACHYVEQQLLSRDQPSVRASYLAALKRAPSLITAAAWMAVLNTFIFTFTFGIGFLFLGAHMAGYAATMRGQGNPLALYSTCSKLLGPARQTASWVRVCGASQLVVFFNLHLAAVVGAQLGNQLLGLDLTFTQRFCSLDNGLWVAAVAAVTFSLYEPLRAATATLLLVDGRVRQEGLDLLAAAEQLPRRKKPRLPVVAATLALLLLPLAASAQGTLRRDRTPASNSARSAVRERVERLVDECDLQGRVDRGSLEDIDALADKDRSSLSRFVSRVERRAYDAEDCDAAEADLREGLKQIHAARVAEEQQTSASAREQASTILARPEFQTAPPVEKVEEEKKDEPPGWLASALERFFKWLRDLFKDEREDITPPTNISFGGPMLGANVVIIAAVVLVVAFLVFLLLRGRDKSKDQELDADSMGVSEVRLAEDMMSALARPPETWAGLADELAAQGQFREAIRHLYLALLSRLHRDGAIDYDPTRSNWDYLLAFKGPGDAKGRFRELTRRFDFAWYGNLDVNSMAWALFREVAEPLITAPSSEGAPAHA